MGLVQQYKPQGKKRLFDQEFAQEHLVQMGNRLEALSKVIDFERFRPSLEAGLLKQEKKSTAGAKPFDVVLLFKILILQRYYGCRFQKISKAFS